MAKNLVLKISVVKFQMEPGQGDCGTRADEIEGHAAVLSSNGAVEIFAFSKGELNS